MTEGTEAITSIHFAWMAVLAVLVVIAIVAGIRAKRRQVEAEREVEAHAQEAGVELATPSAVDAPAAPLPAPSPQPIAPDAGTRPSARANATLADIAQASPIVDEPIPAASASATAPIVADAMSHEQPSPADAPVTLLKGLGPKVATRLAELGIDRVGQIAALQPAQVTALDAQLGPFTGRMARDRWVEQARLLAAGDHQGFEQVFGRL